MFGQNVRLDSLLSQLESLVTLPMSLLCEPARLASCLRRQEHVCRLVHHDSRFAGITPSISPAEGFARQQPFLGSPLSFRGSNAHERQPHIVEVLYSRPVTVLPGEGLALPNMSVPLRGDAISGIVDSHLAQPHGLRL